MTEDHARHDVAICGLKMFNKEFFVKCEVTRAESLGKGFVVQ